MNRAQGASLLALAGFLLILASMALRWHDAVIYLGYRPLGLPLFGPAPLPPHEFFPFSYGVAALLLLAVALIATRIRRPIAFAWASFLLLLLGLNCLLQIGFSQTQWLGAYLQGRYEYVSLMTFANQNSIPYLAPEIDSMHLAGMEGLVDRLDAALTSLRVGWFIYLAGASCMLLGACFFLPRGPVLRTNVVRATWLFAIFLVLHLAGPVSGDFFYHRGLAAERAGHLQAARSDYQLAQVCDTWNRTNPRVYLRIGCVDEAQGHLNSAEYHLQKGLYYSNQDSVELALNEFDLAEQTKDPHLKYIARSLAGNVATAEARSFYGRGSSPGATGSAAAYLQAAARKMSSPVAQNYIAARAFQDSGQLSAALSSLTAAQKETGDVSLQAEIYSSLGDVYYQRKDVIQGRLQYLNSIYEMQNVIEFKNLRAQKDLTTNAFIQ